MPIYNPDHVEYQVTSGHIQIAMEDGTSLPAYWAHPNMGGKFSGIVLIHDWWGVTPLIRLMTTLLAQVGHYVIAPDFYDGKVAQTHNEALQLLNALGDSGYKRANTALSVLENHRNCNGDVAMVGIGIGGSLAFEAAIVRQDLEAAVSYGGFPQRYLGHFKRSNTPILAIYGAEDQYIESELIAQLKGELAATPLKDQHEVVVLADCKHDIFSDDTPEPRRVAAWHRTLDFIDDLLKGPTRPPEKKKY